MNENSSKVGFLKKRKIKEVYRVKNRLNHLAACKDISVIFDPYEDIGRKNLWYSVKTFTSNKPEKMRHNGFNTAETGKPDTDVG